MDMGSASGFLVMVAVPPSTIVEATGTGLPIENMDIFLGFSPPGMGEGDFSRFLPFLEKMLGILKAEGAGEGDFSLCPAVLSLDRNEGILRIDGAGEGDLSLPAAVGSGKPLPSSLGLPPKKDLKREE